MASLWFKCFNTHTHAQRHVAELEEMHSNTQGCSTVVLFYFPLVLGL